MATLNASFWNRAHLPRVMDAAWHTLVVRKGETMDQETAALYRELVNDEKLAEVALTRKAYLSELEHRDPHPRRHHERLEHLGDAWLGAVVTTRLFSMFPDAEEGDLSTGRTSLVDQSVLFEIAREQNLGAAIRAGRGEIKQGQHLTARALHAHLEAMIGAVYLGGGQDAVVRFVDHLWATRWPTSLTGVRQGDYKSELQRLISGRYRGSEPNARYDLEDDEPPLMRSLVSTPWGAMYGEWKTNKKDAEQDAARVALLIVPEDDAAV